MSFHSDGSSKSSNEFRLAHLRTGRVKSRLLSNNKDSKHLDNNFKVNSNVICIYEIKLIYTFCYGFSLNMYHMLNTRCY